MFRTGPVAWLSPACRSETPRRIATVEMGSVASRYAECTESRQNSVPGTECSRIAADAFSAGLMCRGGLQHAHRNNSNIDKADHHHPWQMLAKTGTICTAQCNIADSESPVAPWRVWRVTPIQRAQERHGDCGQKGEIAERTMTGMLSTVTSYTGHRAA